MKKWLGISILSLCLLVGFSLPATAAQVTDNLSISGQVGLYTGWIMHDDDLTGDDSTTDVRWNPWDTAWIAADYSADKWMAKIKIDLDNNDNVRNEVAYIDTAYAQVDFDAFELGFGLNNPLTCNPIGTPPGKYCNSDIGSSIGGTNKYGARLIFPFGQGLKFEAMLGGPTTEVADQIAAGYTLGGPVDVSTEVSMPAIEARFSGFTGFPWAVYGGYQTYEMTVPGDEVDIDSYVVGATVRPKVGPVALNFTANYATNLYQTEGPPWGSIPGFTSEGPVPGTAAWNWDEVATDDIEKLGFGGSAMFDITETVGVTFGVVYQKFELNNDEDPDLGYWVNFPIQITQNLNALPYVFVNDFDTITIDDNESEQGTETQVGVLWRLNF